LPWVDGEKIKTHQYLPLKVEEKGAEVESLITKGEDREQKLHSQESKLN